MYIQTRMAEYGQELWDLMQKDNTYVYMCGLKGMESGIQEALGEFDDGLVEPRPLRRREDARERAVGHEAAQESGKVPKPVVVDDAAEVVSVKMRQQLLRPATQSRETERETAE